MILAGEHYVAPIKYLPKCETCQPIESILDLGQFNYQTRFTKKGLPRHTIRCKNEENVLPSNEPFMIAEVRNMKIWFKNGYLFNLN